MAIFFDFLVDSLDVFIDDFFIFGDDFDGYLAHLKKIIEVYTRNCSVGRNLIFRYEID